MPAKRLFIASVSFVIVVAALLSGRSPAFAQQTGATVVIAVKTSLLRAQPSLQAEVVQQIARDTEFKVTASTEDWIKVSLEDGNEGWLPRKEIGIKLNHEGKVCVEMKLSQSLDSGAIQGTFHGNGGSSGDSIILKAKGNLKLEVCPEFERGSRLANRNASGQDMVLRAMEGVRMGDSFRLVPRLSFDPEVETDYVFDAYCLNFSKHNPEESDELVMRGTVQPELQRIVAVKSDDLSAVQLALWAVTDNVSPEDAHDVFQASPADIQNARNVLVGAGLQPNKYRLFSTQ